MLFLKPQIQMMQTATPLIQIRKYRLGFSPTDFIFYSDRNETE
jgi:hypothetical protein